MEHTTLSRVVRIAIAAWAGILLALGIVLFAMSLALSSGVQVPSGAYSSLGALLKVAPGNLKELDEGMLMLPEGSAEDMRGAAFQWFNLSQETKKRLSRVPMKLGHPSSVAGLFDSGLNVVYIKQPFLQVVMHEYAHVNYEQKRRWEKTAFAVSLIRLWFETDVKYERPKKVLLSSFEMAGRYAKEGLPFYPVHEMYAAITEVTMGDLEALPSYLQPFYADFLQPAESNGGQGDR